MAARFRNTEHRHVRASLESLRDAGVSGQGRWHDFLLGGVLPSKGDPPKVPGGSWQPQPVPLASARQGLSVAGAAEAEALPVDGVVPSH